MTEKEAILKQITEGASQCVKCGACIPHCPTYALNPIEGESPRGRIALMQGLTSDQLVPNQTLQSHLYHCLSCRACERVCPTGVPFGSIMDKTRQILHDSSPIQAANPPKLILKLSQSSTWQTCLATFLWLYQRSGLQKLARLSHFFGLKKLKRLESLLPKHIQVSLWKKHYPPAIASRGTVQLFLGCMSNTFDRRTIAASIQLLNAWGYSVEIPRQQTCCGALYLHAGQFQQALENKNTNIQAFASPEASVPIITVGSGCQTTLKDYAHTSNENDSDFSKRTTDICAFLHQSPLPEGLEWKPFPKKVLLHTPCTMKNIIKTGHTVAALLERLPNIRLTQLNHPFCCGAAGMNMIVNESSAEQLADRLLANIEKEMPDIIVTSNIGCMMHLQRKLLAAKHKIPILHPAALLAEQLSRKKK